MSKLIDELTWKLNVENQKLVRMEKSIEMTKEELIYQEKTKTAQLEYISQLEKALEALQ